GQESRLTSAIVEASTLVMEWKIPLSEIPMGPGDTITFDFMSYSEGSSQWDTAWLYEEYYTLTIHTKADTLSGNDVPGKGIAKAPGLQKELPHDNFAKGTVNKK
ncbi:unnamed protein product, partial [marine sediment metagenome]